ncbi:MAG TPA: hypothetical protein VK923_02370 [Euzebyales bacterium]|nr:hypothetical protein [Euzebyales bacterium]
MSAVGALTQVLPAKRRRRGAAATLAIAALFNPLARRVRRAVDRRFNRTRFDADREVDAFVRDLRSRPDLSDLECQVAAVINRTLEPTVLTLWLPGDQQVPRRSSSSH